MQGLQTTRVLVVDDQIEEAQPFMEALAKRSIGSIYFSGDDLDKLPASDEKIRGVRLAALDLDLGIGGEAPQVIDSLLKVLDVLLDVNNGPYVAIVWTSKDDEYFKEFLNRKDDLVCPPIHVIKFEKSQYMGKNSAIDLIFNEVARFIDDSYPMGVLNFWEQTIHNSSGSAVQLFRTDEAWIEHGRQTLRLLLNSGFSVDDTPNAKLSGLMMAFSTLQLDSIESEVSGISEDDAVPLVSPLDTVEDTEAANVKELLNLKLLYTNVSHATVPGTIFRTDFLGCTQARNFPSLDDLLDDMVKGKTDDVKRTQKEKMMESRCVPIAMEITPLCDYQMNKRRQLRFVSGIALAYGDGTTMNPLNMRAEYIKTDRAPIGFNDCRLPKSAVLIWNSHYISVAREDEIGDDGKLVRLRQAPLVDVQAWLGSQANRPGFLSVR